MQSHFRDLGLVLRSLFLFVLVLTSLPGCQARNTLSDHGVMLETSDGARIAAHAYAPTGEDPPGLILVHRAGEDRQVWDSFAVAAQQWGYLVLTLDLRGHGESVEGAGGPLDARNFSEAEWQAMQLDIDAAFRKLVELGADSKDLFLAGEGFGANLALRYTVDHRDVQGVVLLSAGTEYHGINAPDTMAELRTRPSLLVWSERDDYAASCGSALEARAPGHIETRVYPGSGFGADIFSTAPEAMGQVLVWLDQMRAKPAPRAP